MESQLANGNTRGAGIQDARQGPGRGWRESRSRSEGELRQSNPPGPNEKTTVIARPASPRGPKKEQALRERGEPA